VGVVLLPGHSGGLPQPVRNKISRVHCQHVLFGVQLLLARISCSCVVATSVASDVAIVLCRARFSALVWCSSVSRPAHLRRRFVNAPPPEKLAVEVGGGVFHVSAAERRMRVAGEETGRMN